MKIFVLILVATLTYGQALPDAPSTAKRCGGLPCWDYAAPHPSNWTVLRSPEFVYPTAAEWLAMGFDVGVTWRGLQEHKCVEGNPAFGPHPGLGTLLGYNLAAHAAITGLRFGILKAIPVHETSRWRWLPKGVAIGSGMAAAAVHIHAGSSWFTNGCL